jgi:hypothetical protein
VETNKEYDKKESREKTDIGRKTRMKLRSLQMISSKNYIPKTTAPAWMIYSS